MNSSQVNSAPQYRGDQNSDCGSRSNKLNMAKSIGEITDWKSRIDNHQAQNQLVLVTNRIQLLKIEQSKKQRRLEGAQMHSLHMQTVRENHNRYQSMVVDKMNHRAETERLIQELNQKTRQVKHKSETEKAMIQECIKNMKQQEYNSMKKQRDENEKQIVIQRSESQQINAMKKSDIQNQEMECFMKVNQYKKKKFLEFSLQHQNNKIRNLKEKQAKTQILENLEQEEILWLEKLQQSSYNLKATRMQDSGTTMKTAQSPQRNQENKGLKSSKSPKHFKTYNNNNDSSKFIST